MKRANDPRNQFATFRRERFSRSDSAFWKTFSRGVARANLGRELTSVGSSNAFIRKKNAVYASTQFSQGRGAALIVLFSGTSSEQTAYYDGVVSASSQIVTLRNEADSNDATLASQYDSALASAQASNAAAYESATSAAEDAYKEALDDAWLDAYLERLSLGATLKDAYDQATETAKSALEDASDDLRAALFAGYDAFDAEMSEYLRAFNHYQTRIDLGQSVPNDAILNPTYDFEVCFVAGTPVLMADGSRKPIEALEVGDMVLAADHLDPEGTPEPARVARTFDNGLKDVVELTFADGTSLVCTPSHRFYVLERGWVCASEMRVGEFCLNANGERVEFVGREEIAGKRGVYNIEVEGKHTYFAGDGVLVHNECPVCNGNGTIKKGFITKIDVPCPRCQTETRISFEDFAREYITGKGWSLKLLFSDDNWGFYDEDELRIYKMGCIGLAMISITDRIWIRSIDKKGVTSRAPHLRVTKEDITTDICKAVDIYEKYRCDGNHHPALMMIRSTAITSDVVSSAKTSEQLYNSVITLQASLFDYCTLVNIDVGYGMQPMWLHATGGLHLSDESEVLLTPVEMYTDERKGFFIIIPEAEPRKTIKYELSFDIVLLRELMERYRIF